MQEENMFNKLLLNKTNEIASLTLALGLTCIASLQADSDLDQLSTTTKNSVNENNKSTLDSSSRKDLSDQDLLKKVQKKISSGWFSKGFDGVTVLVNEGVVTLKGTVKTLDDKQKVEKEVNDVDGVIDVKSELTIRKDGSSAKANEFPQDNYTTSNDELLNEQIRNDVSRGWLWTSYKSISLSTDNGVVTLKGNVDDKSDQDKIMKEIQKIKGVKSVKSELKFKNP